MKKNFYLYDSLTKEEIEILTYRLYQDELDKAILELSTNSKQGIIRWMKWNKEKFENKMTREIMKKWNIKIEVNKIYESVIRQYIGAYVQEDFMGELYGYKKYFHKGFYKDYGAVLFYARPNRNGKYNIQEFLLHWVDSFLNPKYIKWDKISWRKNEAYSQYWRHLYDVVHHYDSSFSLEEVKILLRNCLQTRNIKYKRITDYEIIF